MAKKEVGFNLNNEDYKAWITNIKKKIKQSQIKAAVKVNYELLDLYWKLGRDIVEKQEESKWGDSFLETMSKDLKKSFPGMKGFSLQNLKSIRYWYRFYNENINGLQLVSQISNEEKMVKSIPCGHNRRISSFFWHREPSIRRLSFPPFLFFFNYILDKQYQQKVNHTYRSSCSTTP